MYQLIFLFSKMNMYDYYSLYLNHSLTNRVFTIVVVSVRVKFGHKIFFIENLYKSHIIEWSVKGHLLF